MPLILDQKMCELQREDYVVRNAAVRCLAIEHVVFLIHHPGKPRLERYRTAAEYPCPFWNPFLRGARVRGRVPQIISSGGVRSAVRCNGTGSGHSHRACNPSEVAPSKYSKEMSRAGSRLCCAKSIGCVLAYVSFWPPLSMPWQSLGQKKLQWPIPAT